MNSIQIKKKSGSYYRNLRKFKDMYMNFGRRPFQPATPNMEQHQSTSSTTTSFGWWFTFLFLYIIISFLFFHGAFLGNSTENHSAGASSVFASEISNGIKL